ncbi:MAG: hypothetical protein IKO37_08910 [Prevotella sp.]|nr:hypothetical protein [Prevotella sp.]
MESIRRVAAHEVDVFGKETLSMAVVEISEGRVVNYYTFSDELPMTEWLGGRIEIKKNEDGSLSAYWQGTLLE